MHTKLSRSLATQTLDLKSETLIFVLKLNIDVFDNLLMGDSETPVTLNAHVKYCLSMSGCLLY